MARGDFSVTADPKDLRRLMYKLQALDDVDTKDPVVNAFRKGADELKSKAKSSIASHGFVRTGGFLRSPSRKVRRRKNVGAVIGFKRGKGYHGSLSHILDLGSKERFTKKGAYRGRIRPSYFWTDIAKTDAPRVMENVMKAIEESVDNILLK